jgi:hypothetical protein
VASSAPLTLPAAIRNAQVSLEVSKHTQQLCLGSWQLLLKGTTPAMRDAMGLKAVGKPVLPPLTASGAAVAPRSSVTSAPPPSSPAAVFYDRYYKHLFTLDPVDSKAVFARSSIQRRSRALLRMVSTCLALVRADCSPHHSLTSHHLTRVCV